MDLNFKKSEKFVSLLCERLRKERLFLMDVFVPVNQVRPLNH